MKKAVCTAALALSILLLAGCGAQNSVQNSSPAPAPQSAGQKEVQSMAASKPTSPAKGAPDFTLSDLAGEEVRLSDFAGQNVYIRYWASWCPICLGGLEDLNTLAGEENDFVVLTMVAPGAKGEMNAEDFKEWFAGVENTQNLRVLLDENGSYMQQIGVRGFPTSQWIGPDGAIIKTQPGAVDNAAIVAGFATTAEGGAAT